MTNSIFLTKIMRLAQDDPAAAQRQREPSAQELCLQLSAFAVHSQLLVPDRTGRSREGETLAGLVTFSEHYDN